MATPATTAAPAATPKLVRVQHWATRAYHEFLLARAKMPFAWGANDCASFAADGILAMTGVDIAADFRGRYTDEASALAAIKTITGGTTIADAAAWCATKHALAEWPYPLLAKRGDLVVFTAGGRLQAGLVHLTGAHVVAPGEKGLMLMRIHDEATLARSWHVGPAEHAIANWSRR
jgi:hypothetical protein